MVLLCGLVGNYTFVHNLHILSLTEIHLNNQISLGPTELGPDFSILALVSALKRTLGRKATLMRACWLTDELAWFL